MPAQELIVDNGRVAESGSHSELLAQGGLYAHLHALHGSANAAAAPAEA